MLDIMLHISCWFSSWLLTISAFLWTFQCFSGVSSGVISTFLTELAPDNLRGMLGSCNQLFLTIAILFSNVLSFKVIFGSETRWQYIFGESRFLWEESVVFLGNIFINFWQKFSFKWQKNSLINGHHDMTRCNLLLLIYVPEDHN